MKLDRILITNFTRNFVIFLVIASLQMTSSASAQTTFGSHEKQQQESKKSLGQLINLIDSAEASGTSVEDTSNLKKMDSHLLNLVYADISGADVIQAAQSSDVKIIADQSVLMDIYIKGSLDQAVTQLEGMGMQVMATNDNYGGVVEGYLPVDSLIPATNLSFTKALMPVLAYGVGTGSVTSQGDASHQGPAARVLGSNGAGVVAGIISDSMNQVGSGVAGSQTSGDLPASVTVLSDQVGGSDEGRAMAEIIYDTAPGITSMYFASGTTAGPAAKAASINNLVSHGVDIIADDILFYGEPFFQDGMIAQAVDNAYNSGVAYFACAGNFAKQSYESNFRNNGSGYHDFDSGVLLDNFQTVTTVPNGARITLVLQWDDPWGSATHDFDFYLINANTLAPLASSDSDNIYFGLPLEIITWVNTTGSAVTVADTIYRFSGSNTAFLKYIAFTSTGNTFSIIDYNTSSDTIGPDAASASGAMTVAAVYWNDSGLNDPEVFSSRGPKTHFFDVAGGRLTSPEIRQKPDIAGADGVSTSFGFGGGLFFGTSAATPSVAGVAALMLSDWPAMPPSVLYTVLKNPASTIDCSAPGNPDSECGFGFVLSNNAVIAARNYALTINDTAGVFRPSNGLLYLKNYNTSGFANVAINYGIPADYPVVGDWDGNGTATIGVYRNGQFLLRNSNTLGFADLVFAFGAPGDQPIAGDWDNNGFDTIGVFRPTTGQFLLRNSNSAGVADASFFLGNLGDVGIAGDWDGNGTDTTGVFRPSNGVLFMKNANTSGFADIGINYGIPGDFPVIGDWNNDGIDTIGVYRNGQFLLRNSNTLGFADIVFALGIPGDMPIAGNWDAIP